MGHDIKQLKPSKLSRYKQGYIDPKSCKKLFEGLANDRIIYRSSYEKDFVCWLEHNQNVYRWGSECLCIKYMNLLDKKEHNYYPDYVVEMANGDIYIIEIKPKNQTIKPKNMNSYAGQQWIRNMCKWKATRRYCESRGLHFKILTEETISRL